MKKESLPPSPVIKNIIFDIGGVLIGFEPVKIMRELGFSDEKIEVLSRLMFCTPEWDEIDRGVLTQEEVLARFTKKAPEYEEDFKTALHGLYVTMRTYDYTEKWILDLKEAGYHVYFLSNYGEFARELSEQSLAFTRLMDGGVFSYEVKMLKPSRWIYEELLDRYSLNREECVFLDDNPANVEAARKIGMKGIHFRNQQQAIEELKVLTCK